MMSFVDLISVIESDVAVAALAQLGRQVRGHAWQGFASALECQDRRRGSPMISGAIDAAFQLRMIALLERAQDDRNDAVTMSPALRAALDRYARFKVIEMGRKVIGRNPIGRALNRPASGERRIVGLCRELGKHAFDWLKPWLARMRDRGR